MNWIDDTIAAFGRTIGIPGLALDADGCIELEFRGQGLAGVRHLTQQAPPDLLVLRARPVAPDFSACFRRALRLADFRRPGAWPMHAALQDERLLLGLRIPVRAFTLDALVQAFSELDRLHAQVAQTG